MPSMSLSDPGSFLLDPVSLPDVAGPLLNARSMPDPMSTARDVEQQSSQSFCKDTPDGERSVSLVFYFPYV
jgi:hypothetical protein